MNNPLVSVIVPCYNGARFIDRCITSIIEQSYKNIQIIFVDDGSTDNTPEIIKTYPQVTYIYQHNTGLAGAIKTGFEKSAGKYITLLDVDDMYLPGCIEKRVIWLENNPDFNIVRSNGYYVKENDLKNNRRLFITDTVTTQSEDIFEGLITGKTVNWAGSYMVRTEPLKVFYCKHEFYTDCNAQNLQILMPLAYNGKCGFINEALSLYILQENSLSQENNKAVAFERTLKNYLGYNDIRLHLIRQIVSDPDKQHYYISLSQYHNAKACFWHAYEYNKIDCMKQHLDILEKLSPNIIEEKIAYHQERGCLIDKVLFVFYYIKRKLQKIFFRKI